MAVMTPPSPVLPEWQDTAPVKVERWSHLRRKFDVSGTPYLYIAPFFVVFAAFGLFPLLYTGWMAVTQWNRDIPGSDHTFVGLGNFVRLVHDDFFWNALRNTA